MFTGKYVDAIGLLLAQAAAAQLDEREPALPDPDVTQLRIEVQVRTVFGDPAATALTGQPFVPVYSTIRKFPDAPNQPLHLEFAFENLHNLTTLDGRYLRGRRVGTAAPSAQRSAWCLRPWAPTILNWTIGDRRRRGWARRR